MEFTFLGTSSGIPTKERNVSGLALRAKPGGSWLLIDCGEASQHQLQKLPYSLLKLEAIFITHVHGDHCYGLPGLLGSMSMAGRKEPLKIVAPVALHQWVRNTIELTDSYMCYDIDFYDVETLSNFETDDFCVNSHQLSHRVKSFGYSFVEQNIEATLDVEKLETAGIPRGPMWGKIQASENVICNGQQLVASDFLAAQRKPRKIVIGGDNDTPSLLKDACKNADVLVHEATYTQAVAEAVGSGPMHSAASWVGKFAEQLQVPNLLLTHFSARYQKHSDMGKNDISEIYEDAHREYSGQLFLARDLQTYRLSKKPIALEVEEHLKADDDSIK